MPPEMDHPFGYVSDEELEALVDHRLMSITSSAQKLRELREKLKEDRTVSGVRAAPAPKTKKPDVKELLGPLGCWTCGSQEKGRHMKMCPVVAAIAKAPL